MMGESREIEAKRLFDERIVRAKNYYEKEMEQALEAYRETDNRIAYEKAIKKASKEYKSVIRWAQRNYDNVMNPMKRMFNIIIGGILVALALMVWTLAIVGPRGPADYDVEIDGRYYVEDVISDDPTGLERGGRVMYNEIPWEKVHRPPIESPFWRFWDNWGLAVSLLTLFLVLPLGVSRLMPALMRTEE